MKLKQNLIIRFYLICKELLKFLWERKLWWLIPMILVLFLIGLLLIIAQVTAVGPFIYTLF